MAPETTEIRTRPYPNCALCGAKGASLYQGLRDRLFGASGTWNFNRCPNPECGLVWLDPTPIEEDIGKAYETYYTHGANYEAHAGPVHLLLRTAYLGVNEMALWATGIRAKREQLRRMYLSEVASGRLLEIGFGEGQFLDRMRGFGWQVEGVDFDQKAVEAAREKYGLTVHLGTLESMSYPSRAFDAITMNHVIEHVPDPTAVLTECRRILRPRGRLVMVTPNISSFGHQRFTRNWMGLDPPRHLHLFSQRTLRTCVGLAGFTDLMTWTTPAHADVILGASQHLEETSDPGVGVSHRQRLVRKLRLFGLQRHELLSLSESDDVGEELVVMARGSDPMSG